MIKTVLMDYDSTIHDMDGAMEIKLDGILGFSGKELYRLWVYDIHRGLIHQKYLEYHDDIMFHCRLLFKQLDEMFDEKIARKICDKFKEAQEEAKYEPIYYPDAIPSLDKLKKQGYQMCLSTGYNAIEKADTLEEITGKKFFDYIFSESILGVLKTETEYYNLIIEKTDSLPSETVSVGDTPLSDIRPAKLIGIHTIWVNRINEAKPLEEEQIPEFEVQDLFDAFDIIKNLG
jgi:putative hydrolase of the HAD superfamily